MGWIDQIRSRLRGAPRASDPAEHGPRPPRSPASRDEVEAHLRGFMAENSDGLFTPDAFEAEAHLFDTGYIDSMSSLRLLVFVEERYGVEVFEVDLVGDLCTLSALAEHVSTKTSVAA